MQQLLIKAILENPEGPFLRFVIQSACRKDIKTTVSACGGDHCTRKYLQTDCRDMKRARIYNAQIHNECVVSDMVTRAVNTLLQSETEI